MPYWKPFLTESLEWALIGTVKFSSNLATGCLNTRPTPVEVECS